MNMYHDRLMDHFKKPRHKDGLEHPTFSSGEVNPSCGDAVTIKGRVQDGQLVDASFDGKGCVISQATASLLLEAVIGRSLQELDLLDGQFMKELVGIPLGPMRMRCALLPLEALKAGLKK